MRLFRGTAAAAAAVVLVLVLAGRGALGLYFHIGETEKRCFIEEIPDETMVIGNYRTQLWDKHSEAFLPSTPGLGMLVEVKDPDGKVVLSRQYGSEGRFTFTSHTPGEHQICLHSNSTRMALFAGGKLVRPGRNPSATAPPTAHQRPALGGRTLSLSLGSLSKAQREASPEESICEEGVRGLALAGPAFSDALGLLACRVVLPPGAQRLQVLRPPTLQPLS
ncbi:hypothetical protein JD844_030876 [Phrynosoma platyrhinos]|uniref:GOLD domain-containing protein n=1 Tax=Phrynosoma platyrhinos TaxID=52577 RepID=A0ABQ7T050_PHRPL|nr:hypothetical protein JD844_030876 [Phrynosoma platyrhinos]